MSRVFLPANQEEIDTHVDAQEWLPEHYLTADVLIDAYLCLQRFPPYASAESSNKTKKAEYASKRWLTERRKVRLWVESDRDSGPFAFLWCCRALRMDPDQVRERFMGCELWPISEEEEIAQNEALAAYLVAWLEEYAHDEIMVHLPL